MNSKQGQECCALAVTWSTLKILYPADPVCTQSGSLLKLTLLSKSSQSMCKYRLCNLDLKRSLYTKKGAVSSSKKACSFKILNIFQNILSSLCNGQFDFFLWHSKGLESLIKRKPMLLVLLTLLVHRSGFQTLGSQQQLLISHCYSFWCYRNSEEQIGTDWTTHPSS